MSWVRIGDFDDWREDEPVSIFPDRFERKLRDKEAAMSAFGTFGVMSGVEAERKKTMIHPLIRRGMMPAAKYDPPLYTQEKNFNVGGEWVDGRGRPDWKTLPPERASFDPSSQSVLRPGSSAQSPSIPSGPGMQTEHYAQTTWYEDQKGDHIPIGPAGERARPGETLETAAMKLDVDKPPVRQGVLEYFPRALLEIARVSAVGARKYAWGNCLKPMEDGVNRFGNAEVRHILGAAIEGEYDKATGCLHAAQEAWECLMRLETILKEKEKSNA